MLLVSSCSYSVSVMRKKDVVLHQLFHGFWVDLVMQNFLEIYEVGRFTINVLFYSVLVTQAQ